MRCDMQYLGWNLQFIDNRFFSRLPIEDCLIDILTIHLGCNELPLALSSGNGKNSDLEDHCRSAKRLAPQRLVGHHQTYFSGIRLIG